MFGSRLVYIKKKQKMRVVDQVEEAIQIQL